MYSDKVELDKFYTKEKVSLKCINYFNLEDYDLIIEPSVGNGSFYNSIKHINKIGIDLKPEINNNPNILEMNWFDYNIESKNKKVLVIGNPPFGKRNDLSQKFLIHAMSFNNVYTIGFILPTVYNKHTLQKNLSKDFRLRKIYKLPKNSFLLNGEEYNVPCSFFIFERSNGKCLKFNIEKYKKTKDWEYGTDKNSDFYIMGAAPKTIKELNEVEINNRGYYIKVKDKKNIDKIKNNFLNINWNTYSSSNGGVFWLTKPELVKGYKDLYDKNPVGRPRKKNDKI